NEGNQAETYAQNAWKEFKAGWDYIVSVQIVKLTIFFASARLFLIFLFDTLLILWAKNLHIQASAYGLLVSAGGVASVIGALGAGQWKYWERKPLESICWATILSGGLVLGLGFISCEFQSVNLYLLIGLFFIIGLAGAIVPVAFGYILQTKVTPGILGRVVGTANGIQNLFMLTAPGLGALLAKIWGINTVLVIAGLGSALLGIIVLARSNQKCIITNSG
ncbi:MAG TPA: MFS transporter, partial [Bacillota bacterium]|nr:MFS transporter [Bacillota bacterium]